jgi:hypothetical protein
MIKQNEYCHITGPSFITKEDMDIKHEQLDFDEEDLARLKSLFTEDLGEDGEISMF